VLFPRIAINKTLCKLHFYYRRPSVLFYGVVVLYLTMLTGCLKDVDFTSHTACHQEANEAQVSVLINSF